MFPILARARRAHRSLVDRRLARTISSLNDFPTSNFASTSGRHFSEREAAGMWHAGALSISTSQAFHAMWDFPYPAACTHGVG